MMRLIDLFPSVVVVDTSILLNVLDVPGRNQSRSEVLKELGRILAASRQSLLLPMAAIVETGNHIANLDDGRQRRRFGTLFAEQVVKAFDGEAPWTPTGGLDPAVVRTWMAEFPDCVMRGVGMGDLSIIKEWEAACARHPAHRVRIWSLDGDLAGYDRMPASATPPVPARRR